MTCVRWWEWCVLILTILVVLGLLWAYYGAPNINQQYVDSKSTTLQYFMKNADNGDLLFLSGDSRGERGCRWASGSVFSHVGLLFREKHPETDEDTLYVWEADIGQGSKSGPRIMKVQDKLKRYKGFKILGWKPLQGPRPLTKKILNTVQKHSDKTLDSQMWSWIFEKIPGFSLLNRWIKDPKKVFCSELLVTTLQDLEMMDTRVKAYSLSPQDFHENRSPGLLPSYEYLETLYVVF